MSPYSIVSGAMGNFLMPPGHPNHHFEGHAPGCLISVECAAAEGCAAAQRLLDAYVPPPIESPEVQAWIQACLNHWRSCFYAGSDRPAIAGFDPIPEGATPYAHWYIRRWYPSF